MEKKILFIDLERNPADRHQGDHAGKLKGHSESHRTGPCHSRNHGKASLQYSTAGGKAGTYQARLLCHHVQRRSDL